MSNTTVLSESKRALLEKYLQGRLPQTPNVTSFIPQRTPSSIAPLSIGQQQLWILAQLMPDTPVYTECVTIHLPGPLQREALEYSFNEILKRHEAWRTSFPIIDGQPMQRIHPYARVPLPIVDLSDFPEGEREGEALHLARRDAQRPFDLANGPLLRPMLVCLNATDHRLFLTIHHIIFDGFSLYQIFLPELRTLYDAYIAGKPSPLPDLPIQYADVAIWQREWLQGEMLTKQLAYWKQQLENIPAHLDLPTDRPRPEVPTYHGSMHPFAFSRELTEGLKALSRQEGVTLYMTLVAAFQTLLHRYTGQGDILLGTAISDRNQSQVQGLMGFFLNTLVLRTNFTDNPTVRQLLHRVREVVLGAHAHQNVPFEYLVKELQPERNLGQNPLFQALISLEPPLTTHPSGWTLTQMDVETDTAKFDLSIELDDRPDGLIGRFEYNTDLFDATTIARMFAHWQTILKAFVAHPEVQISAFPLLTTTEQHLIEEWNNTATSSANDICLHQLFESQVKRTPDEVAVIFEHEHLTYQELNGKANQLAHYLQRQGVGPEVLVGICMDRSLDMVVSLLAILKAGGAYVPLDPKYPKERLAFTLQDSQAPVLLTQKHLMQYLPQHTAKTVYMDAERKLLAQESEDDIENEVTTHNLAYIIYTSGSTGVPKGVAIEHASVVAFIEWSQSVFSPKEVAGVLASTSICFDLSVFELFVPLSSGGTVILAEDVLQVQKLPARNQITLINTVPSAMAELLRNSGLPHTVSTVNLAGEPLHATLVQQVYQQGTVKRVFNLYGPSEDTTYSTYASLENSEREPSIGRPISNTQAHILDIHLQPVPIGVAGELYLGGSGLARGYLNRPELTMERFVPDPFSQRRGARLYRTGDLVRYRHDGNIEFLGRMDNQVKLRGFRIELGEIEETLRKHSDVQDVIVVIKDNKAGERHLIAYIRSRPSTSLSYKVLRNYLQERLPGYMVPSFVLFLDTFPMLPNGKVNRDALPPLPDSTIHEEETYIAPKQLMEYRLMQIWEELLDTHPISITDNFFYLGGHSLLAARLIARIEQAFGKKLSLSTFFAGPTIEQVANALEEQEQKIGTNVPVVQIQGGSKRPLFFLHGDWTGGAFFCFTIARKLGPDQPFYAMEPYKFHGLQTQPTLEEIAAAYIDAMRAIQPEGPYLISGFCNGGLIAYEMARQLEATGQRVELLVLIDPSSPSLFRKFRQTTDNLNRLLRIEKQQQTVLFLRSRHVIRHFYRQLSIRDDERLQDFYKLAANDPRFNLMFPPIDALDKDYIRLFMWAASQYEIGYYTGKVTLFWASEEPFRGFWKRWKEKAKNGEFHIIPGTHLSILTDSTSILAERLSQCLHKAQIIVARQSAEKDIAHFQELECK